MLVWNGQEGSSHFSSPKEPPGWGGSPVPVLLCSAGSPAQVSRPLGKKLSSWGSLSSWVQTGRAGLGVHCWVAAALALRVSFCSLEACVQACRLPPPPSLGLSPSSHRTPLTRFKVNPQGKTPPPTPPTPPQTVPLGISGILPSLLPWSTDTHCCDSNLLEECQIPKLPVFRRQNQQREPSVLSTGEGWGGDHACGTKQGPSRGCQAVSSCQLSEPACQGPQDLASGQFSSAGSRARLKDQNPHQAMCEMALPYLLPPCPSFFFF